MMDWDAYHMGFAQHAALKSKDSTQVGAVLVGKNREVLLTGFNGPPINVKDSPERRERPEKYLFASHAECNTLAFAARNGIKTEGLTLFVTHYPCSACAKMIIQAGISKLVVGQGKTSMPADEFRAARTMFAEAYIQVQEWH